jgi:hypothetical protein
VTEVIQAIERRASADVIDEFLSLQGATVVDVGCGGGWLTRLMTERGAHVTGIEVSPRQLALARATKPVGDEHYIQGSAEELPLPNRSVDIVVFFNSLHHVDPKVLPNALREAARVLKHGGVLYVSEPLAEGDYFELMKPVHDETIVRQNAQHVLREAPEYGLLLEKQLVHVDPVLFPHFQAFRDRLTTINPDIRSRFDEEEEGLRRLFESRGKKTDAGWSFDQAWKVAVLRRA